MASSIMQLCCREWNEEERFYLALQLPHHIEQKSTHPNDLIWIMHTFKSSLDTNQTIFLKKRIENSLSAINSENPKLFFFAQSCDLSDRALLAIFKTFYNSPQASFFLFHLHAADLLSFLDRCDTDLTCDEKNLVKTRIEEYLQDKMLYDPKAHKDPQLVLSALHHGVSSAGLAKLYPEKVDPLDDFCEGVNQAVLRKFPSKNFWLPLQILTKKRRYQEYSRQNFCTLIEKLPNAEKLAYIGTLRLIYKLLDASLSAAFFEWVERSECGQLSSDSKAEILNIFVALDTLHLPSNFSSSLYEEDIPTIINIVSPTPLYFFFASKSQTLPFAISILKTITEEEQMLSLLSRITLRLKENSPKLLLPLYRAVHDSPFIKYFLSFHLLSPQSPEELIELLQKNCQIEASLNTLHCAEQIPPYIGALLPHLSNQKFSDFMTFTLKLRANANWVHQMIISTLELGLDCKRIIDFLRKGGRLEDYLNHLCMSVTSIPENLYLLVEELQPDELAVLSRDLSNSRYHVDRTLLCMTFTYLRDSRENQIGHLFQHLARRVDSFAQSFPLLCPTHIQDYKNILTEHTLLDDEYDAATFFRRVKRLYPNQKDFPLLIKDIFKLKLLPSFSYKKRDFR